MSAIFGEHLIIRQASGSDVELVVHGDEFYARLETPDGYTVVYDATEGLYCYAIVRGGRFVSSGIPLTKRPPRGLKRHVQESDVVQGVKFEQRYETLRCRTMDLVEARTFGPNNGLLPGRQVSRGEVLGLTIMVEFRDERAAVTAAELNDLLNGGDFTRNGNFSSVREYFRLVSNGRLDYRNEVVGPIRLDRDKSFYETHSLVPEVIERAVEEHDVDLSRFDSLGHGVVDAINILYAGRTVYGVAGDDNVPSDLWPHNASVDLSFDGIETDMYMLASLGRRAVDMSIGTICHESGHLLCRFPDLYDYGRRDGDPVRSRGIGPYCLMGAGNHLDRGRTPSPVCGYLRDLAGWVDNVVSLNVAGEYEARHGDYGTIYRFDTDKPNEYFIVENRSHLGLDAHLPSGGLAVYHCDTDGSNEWQGGTAARHYQCGVIQADGRQDLESNRPADSTDLYGEVDGVALSADTFPDARAWDGSDSGLLLADVSAPGEVIRFRAGAAVTPVSGDTVTVRVAPDLLIPDDQPEGIRSEIRIDRGGRLRAVTVDIDITHTWIGDLQIELESPAGDRVLVHDKTGGGADDLRVTYSSETSAALAALVDQPIEGSWLLHVSDVQQRDVGRLNEWSLTLAYEAGARVVRGEAAPGLDIPDMEPQGIESAIALAEDGEVAEIRVGVEISHTFIRDLQVQLVAPSGVTATLHDRTGGSADDIRRTYDLADTAPLEVFVGLPVRGDWRLQIRDLEGADVGVLESWELEIRTSA